MAMKVFKKLGGWRQDLELNKNEGMLSFALFRLSGLVLAAFVFWNFGALFRIDEGAAAVRSYFPAGGSFLVSGGWFLLCGALAFHTLHGLRTMLVELLGLYGNQRALTLSTLALFVVVMTLVLVPFLW